MDRWESHKATLKARQKLEKKILDEINCFVDLVGGTLAVVLLATLAWLI